MDNLSRTLYINFYQNWSSIVEVMTKKLVCFLCPTVYAVAVCVLSVEVRFDISIIKERTE